VEANAGRVARDAADALAVLTNTKYEMKVVQDRWPDIKFHTQREHAGLMADRITDPA
jgi:peptide chain release factor 3